MDYLSICLCHLWFLSLVQFSHSVMSNSLQPHGLQHARPPYPSPTPGIYSNSCPLSWWCHPTISSSIITFSSHLQYFPASGSFQMSQSFPSGGKVLKFQLEHQSSNEHSGLISFRMNWLDLLSVQGTLKSLLQHHSVKASILQHSAFFIVQLSHPYMTTGKTVALTRQTFVGKVMSLLFNMLFKHPLPTTQEKTLHMEITRWSTLKSDWLYSLQPKVEKLYTVSKNKTGSWLWLRSWTPYCQIQT